jgi:hypothetical protein
MPPLPQYAFMAWCSVTKKHRDILYITVAKLRTLMVYSGVVTIGTTDFNIHQFGISPFLTSVMEISVNISLEVGTELPNINNTCLAL